MKITIGIKALNEEMHIAESLRSAIAAAKDFGGEVILADCGSTDRTIDIARTFPVRIVQLSNSEDRSCGAGTQLAFQFSRGDYFYMLDGDMVLYREFLAAGISYLSTHPDVAAVGGHVRERNVGGDELQIRVRSMQYELHRHPGIVDRLDGGGLFRSSAIRDVGYFADRNLHGWEEFELGARLQARGWKLIRLDRPAVDHYGHVMGGYRLLWHRIRLGYPEATGEILRAAFGRSHFSIVLRRLDHIRISLAVILWWILVSGCIFMSPFWSVALIVIPLLFLSYRRGALKLGLYSLALWNVNAWGLLSGLMRRPVSPEIPLMSVELSSCPESEDIKSIVQSFV